MKRTEIIIETHEVWVIRRHRGHTPALCVACADQPAMLTPEGAALLCGLGRRAIYHLVEAGSVHFQETADGELFVCPASLSAAIRPDDTPELNVTPSIISKEYMP